VAQDGGAAMTVRFLDQDVCKEDLAKLGFKLHQGRLILIDGKTPIEAFDFMQLVMPSQSNELFNFAVRLTDWLPDGEWIAIAINSYSHFNAIQQRVLKLLVERYATVVSNLEFNGKVFYISTKDEHSRADCKVLISCLAYWILVFEGDCRIISSASPNGNFISLDDGVAHLALSKSAGVKEREIFESIISEPTNMPSWAIKLITEEQNKFTGITE
jgi:hypothetical protein